MKKLTTELACALKEMEYEFNATHERPHHLKLQGQISPATYKDFKRILEALNGKWERKFEIHTFEENPMDIIEQILLKNELPEINPLDFYPTPENLVTEMLDSLRTEIEDLTFAIERGEEIQVLEPEAGTGAIAKQLAELLGGTQHVVCIELNPVNAKNLRKLGFEVIETDFLAWKTTKKFPLIVMNPPFQGTTWKKHLDHAKTMLAPNGDLACIAPISALKATTPNEKFWLREMLARGSYAIHPDNSFIETGTSIQTIEFLYNNTNPNNKKQVELFDLLLNNSQVNYDLWKKETKEIKNKNPHATWGDLSVNEQKQIENTLNTINDNFLKEPNNQIGIELIQENYKTLFDSEMYEFRNQNNIVSKITKWEGDYVSFQNKIKEELTKNKETTEWLEAIGYRASDKDLGFKRWCELKQMNSSEIEEYLNSTKKNTIEETIKKEIKKTQTYETAQLAFAF
jgi:hypothetical protein